MAKRPKVPPGNKSKYEISPKPIPRSRSKSADVRYSALDTRILMQMEKEMVRQFMGVGDSFSYDEPKRKRDKGFIMPGDTIIALRDGEQDSDGLPLQVPQAGCRYVVDSFYVAPYGIGVVLSNVDGTPMDNYPFRGYVFVRFTGTVERLSAVPYFKADTEDGT